MKELMEAMQILHDHCIRYEDCEECIFWRAGRWHHSSGCYLENEPENWDPKHELGLTEN